jgi:glycosyltransferase involved in cell wall biosynthesis
MKVLLLNQFFAPDSAATSQLLTDVARELTQQGHSVTVICSGSIYATLGSTEAPGVEVRRVRNMAFGRGKVQRLCSYASYLMPAFWLALWQRSPDVIVSMTTPPGLSVVGGLVAWVKGSKHFIWEMDVYPDVAEALGVLRPDGWVTRVLGWAFDLSRKSADGILTLGDCMATRIKSRGISVSKIHVTENWADGDAIRPCLFRADGKLSVLYSGNLGLVHELDTVSAAMLQMREESRMEFIFAGGGRMRAGLERFCAEKGLRQVVFEDYCSRENLARRLSEGDIGLVTQRPETAGCVVPSKSYGVLAAGRPVLFIGPAESTIARMISRYQCGWHVEAGDVQGLVGLLQRLVDEPELVWSAGGRAREVFLRHYDLPEGVARVCEALGCAVEENVRASAAI